jgi:hypothetical protein
VKFSIVSIPPLTVSKDEKVAVLNHAQIIPLQRRVVVLTYSPHSKSYSSCCSTALKILYSPSNEWQDRVVSLLSSSLSLSSQSRPPTSGASSYNNPRTIQLLQSRTSPSLSLDDNGRRQRRRLGSSSSPDPSDHSQVQAPASTDSEDEDDVVDAVGQLSLNEDEQVRYHGKASGLYLLGYNAKEEARNEGGIW